MQINDQYECFDNYNTLKLFMPYLKFKREKSIESGLEEAMRAKLVYRHVHYYTEWQICLVQKTK